MYLAKSLRISSLVSLLLIGCSTTEHAPVVDRAPVAKKPATTASQPASASSMQAGSDWRPNTHIVKKGDTLYSIGLEYGFDYKELAQANNIAAPAYTIHVGQQLKLPARAIDPVATSSPIPGQPASITDGDVIITPLNLDGGAAPSTSTPGQATDTTASFGQPLLIVEPKALRQPYSEAALNAPVPAPQTQVATVPAPASTATTPMTPATTPATTTTSPAATSGIAWTWPTSGKVIAGFNDSASTKGLDIGGTLGQPIKAAAPGKVIYSGSDLRGYGKLVIIKHDSTYLSVYAHNSNILVKEGQQVTQGQKIAEMGDSDTDMVKLHFEIRRQGKSVDPAKYLPAAPG